MERTRINQSFLNFLRTSWRDGIRIYWQLLLLVLPLLLAIRILDNAFNIVERSGQWIAPLMSWVGLPGECGIVLTIGMLLNLYAAMLMLASLLTTVDLTVAQVTVLMSMCLVAHALPVETRIAQQVGMRLIASLLWRIVNAFLLGVILHHLYADSWLQTPAVVQFAASPITLSWRDWLINEGRNWLVIFITVQALVLFVNGLKISRLDRWISKGLAPLLRLVGIHDKATVMTIIGLLLGISYGGGLMIEEKRRGNIDRRQLLCAIAMLSLCHSIVEDTLLVMLVGAHWSGVFIGRLLFTIVMMFVFARLIWRASDRVIDKIAPPISSP